MGGHRFGAKRRNFFGRAPQFFGCKVQLVVLVSAFVMSVQFGKFFCLPFFYSRCPRAQPFVKGHGVGATDYKLSCIGIVHDCRPTVPVANRNDEDNDLTKATRMWLKFISLLAESSHYSLYSDHLNSAVNALEKSMQIWRRRSSRSKSTLDLQYRALIHDFLTALTSIFAIPQRNN